MKDSDKIEWAKDYLLKWSDFKAEQNPAEFHPAKTTIQYSATWKINWINTTNKISYSINEIQLVTEFQKFRSWVRQQEIQDNERKENILNHEQGHFDLAEKFRIIITEKIQSKFSENSFPVYGKDDEHVKDFVLKDSKEKIELELEKQTNDIFRKQEETYDRKTEYGSNSEKQHEFDIEFAKLREK